MSRYPLIQLSGSTDCRDLRCVQVQTGPCTALCSLYFRRVRTSFCSLQGLGSNHLILSYLPRSLADRWGTTVDFTISFILSSRFSAFRCSIFHSRPVHSLVLSSYRFLCLRTMEEGRGPRERGRGLGVESYRGLKHWHLSGYPARRLAL